MKTPARRRIGLFLASLCLPPFAQTTETRPIHEFSLGSGLKVTTCEDHRAPAVVSQLRYRVGSSYEIPGLTGLSHALKYMMFKGSRKPDPGEASQILHDLGVRENTPTTDGYTTYCQILARDRLPVVLEMEVDRTAHLSLPADQFKSETEVIKGEHHLHADDNSDVLTFERFRTAAYPASGYYTPTIGWMADLQRMTIDDLRHWYESWYAPNNAILVVVGDVIANEIKTLVKRYSDEIPWRQSPPIRKLLELAESGKRRFKPHARTQLPNLVIGFNVPSPGSSENPCEANALRLTGTLLDGGYSARLASRLGRSEELVAGASTYYSAFNRNDSLFVFSVTPNVWKGETLKQVEAGLWKQLGGLKQSPPSATEIERTRAQMITGMVCEKGSIAAQASSIGQLENVGLPWKLIDQDLEALRAMTPDDIQRAACTHFTSPRLILVQVLPMKTEEKEVRHE